MTPGARVAAAIEMLDRILGGEPAEKTLTNWARRNRYAGSKDRAAVRDLVYDALRCRLSYGWLGGGDTGRALMLGRLRALGENPDDYFTGAKYAPQPVDSKEKGKPLAVAPEHVRCDVPAWLWPEFQRSCGADAAAVAGVLRRRAPVFLRVNIARTTVDKVVDSLAGDGIRAARHPLAQTALEVIDGARRVTASAAYRGGLVELQDAASQAVVEALPVRPGTTVLDYCAGGGGKALAMAARGAGVTAHDAKLARMRDIPVRAARAGVSIEPSDQLRLRGRRFDLVLCDVPCSGSGAWRRSPEGKWRLTRERLARLHQSQGEILQEAAGHVADGGILAYATCSLLVSENREQIARFLDLAPGWRLTDSRQFSPLEGADGFYVALLTREEAFG